MFQVRGAPGNGSFGGVGGTSGNTWRGWLLCPERKIPQISSFLLGSRIRAGAKVGFVRSRFCNQILALIPWGLSQFHGLCPSSVGFVSIPWVLSHFCGVCLNSMSSVPIPLKSPARGSEIWGDAHGIFWDHRSIPGTSPLVPCAWGWQNSKKSLEEANPPSQSRLSLSLERPNPTPQSRLSLSLEGPNPTPQSRFSLALLPQFQRHLLLPNGIAPSPSPRKKKKKKEEYLADFWD